MRVPVPFLCGALTVASLGCTLPDVGGGAVEDASHRQVVDVGDAPAQGPASAPVTLVEFADFQCPYCGLEEPVIERLLSTYSERLRFVYKEYPLSSIHRYAELAAEAALAANAQGKFWPYHDALYAHQRALTRTDLESYATSLGLDITAFRAALDQRTFQAAVEADVAQGTALGLKGTPTFFVNGRMGEGALPFDALTAAIDEELAASP